MSKQRRSLSMHPKLLLDVIGRQAGSLDKAVLEGVMNAVEAMAEAKLKHPKVEIEFTPAEGDKPAHLRISDKGKGIRDEAEIVAFFETFGTPHTEAESTIWKQFRMGRGQLFSFGINKWRTATFNLTVDIAKWGLNYEFEDGLPFVEGCVIDIDLYKNPIGTQYSSIEAFKAAIKTQVEYMAVPVLFNGEQLSTDPATLTWDDQDENAYYLWARGTNLTIYNLGALCKTVPASTMGVTGVVVSKKQLKINFARNDIQHDCPVWQEIQDVIKDNRVKKTRNISKRLEAHERLAVLQDLRDGEQDYDELKNIALLATTSGRALTLHFIRMNRSHWTFAPAYDRVADKLMQGDTALCIDNAILRELSYSGDPAKFFEWLVKNQNCPPSFTATTKLFVPFKDISSGFKRTSTLLPSNKLTIAERRIIRLLEQYDNKSQWYGNTKRLLRGRTVCVGVSDTADAWTDGETYIAFNRFFLKRHAYSSTTAAVAIMTTLAHELSHDENDSGTHVHGEEFYRYYHDLTIAEDGSNPLYWIATYHSDMKDAKLQEKMDAAVERDKAAKERIDRKLRRRANQPIAAKVCTVSQVSEADIAEPEVVATLPVTPPVRVAKGRRRPKGLEE